MSSRSERIRQALGAGPPHQVRTLPHGPFGAAQLRAELAERLHHEAGAHTAGRTDPEWTIERLVAFRPETWHELSELAARASTPERRVSPGQVAAHLIEEGIERLQREGAV